MADGYSACTMNISGEPPSAVKVRGLRVEDIPFAMEVKDLAGWNQTARDWQGYLKFEPQGCFLAEVNGSPAGTATTIRYGNRLGWIGMVLVHPEARRLGIGTKLLQTAINYLHACKVQCVKLDATPTGRMVYLPLGFQDEYEVARYEGVAGDGVPARPLTGADPAAMVALDTEAFGVERSEVLRSLSRRDPELCFRCGNDGYLIARRGQNAVQVGPWIARDAEVAEELLRALLSRIPRDRVLVDVPYPNRVAREIMERAGFTVQRSFTRMYLGDNEFPGRVAWVFGTGNAEKG